MTQQEVCNTWNIVPRGQEQMLCEDQFTKGESLSPEHQKEAVSNAHKTGSRHLIDNL